MGDTPPKSVPKGDLRAVDDRGRVTIPIGIREELGDDRFWIAHDEQNERVILHPVEVNDG